jgi:hypothetical protein
LAASVGGHMQTEELICLFIWILTSFYHGNHKQRLCLRDSPCIPLWNVAHEVLSKPSVLTNQALVIKFASLECGLLSTSQIFRVTSPNKCWWSRQIRSCKTHFPTLITFVDAASFSLKSGKSFAPCWAISQSGSGAQEFQKKLGPIGLSQSKENKKHNKCQLDKDWISMNFQQSGQIRIFH